VAIIGQSTFAAEVFKLIKKDGHDIVGVFTVPDTGNREDPLGKFVKALCFFKKINLADRVLLGQGFYS